MAGVYNNLYNKKSKIFLESEFEDEYEDDEGDVVVLND